MEERAYVRDGSVRRGTIKVGGTKGSETALKKIRVESAQLREETNLLLQHNFTGRLKA
ncbi:hypothetical protein SLEP1_g34184 [Rubroshorea leprosula]|uniref:Uncharacterized protein n=1 Tax=Rubroshorea leprosula TaxID=152421 RepID=A0AAV5KJ75_9ROSI|nr:hypothetical protein SLEP1_g34184 [Rubroshorea leprosula]